MFKNGEYLNEECIKVIRIFYEDVLLYDCRYSTVWHLVSWSLIFADHSICDGSVLLHFDVYSKIKAR